jgi:predicted O-methyltransferase YrrM
VNILFEYIKYWWKAKDRHGIHSPFVYDFSDKCLKKAINEEFKSKRSNLYSLLAKDNKRIERIDMGVGSKRRAKTVPLNTIFNVSSSKGKTADLLYRIANHYRPTVMLELGTNLGIGTIHLAAGNPTGQVISIEGCPNTAQVAKENIARMGLSAEIINTDFNSFLTTNEKIVDFVFIDGHHDGEALIHYLNLLSPYTHDETIILLDDIRWSNSMFNAWESLKASEQFHLTIDLFRTGMLMKRSHQQKEAFTVWF